MRARKGFTLIELLVVLGIITVLAAILFPVFEAARAKAKAASCMSNLKQLGMAVFMYTQDYDERYPMDYTYDPTQTVQEQYTLVDALGSYVKDSDVWYCPDRLALDTGSPTFRGNNSVYRGRFADYGWNVNEFGGMVVGPTNVLVSIPMAAINQPSTQIMMGDMMALSTTNKQPLNTNPDPSTWYDRFDGFRSLPETNASANGVRIYFPTTKATSSGYNGTYATNANVGGGTYLGPRHPGVMANALFGDGHVKAVSVLQVYSHGCGDPTSMWCNGL